MIGDAYLLPLTVFFLLLTMAMLAFRARRRWGYGPLLLGAMGTVAILNGKFYLENNATGYAGVALLVAASIWNAWPRKTAAGPGAIQVKPQKKDTPQQ